MNWLENKEAIGRVNDLLASIGLVHGQRKTLSGTWSGQRLGKPGGMGAALQCEN